MGLREGLKRFGREVYQTATQKLQQGADELVNVLYSGSAYLPWPGAGQDTLHQQATHAADLHEETNQILQNREIQAKQKRPNRQRRWKSTTPCMSGPTTHTVPSTRTGKMTGKWNADDADRHRRRRCHRLSLPSSRQPQVIVFYREDYRMSETTCNDTLKHPIGLTLLIRSLTVALALLRLFAGPYRVLAFKSRCFGRWATPSSPGLASSSFPVCSPPFPPMVTCPGRSGWPFSLAAYVQMIIQWCSKLPPRDAIRPAFLVWQGELFLPAPLLSRVRRSAAPAVSYSSWPVTCPASPTACCGGSAAAYRTGRHAIPPGSRPLPLAMNQANVHPPCPPASRSATDGSWLRPPAQSVNPGGCSRTQATARLQQPPPGVSPRKTASADGYRRPPTFLGRVMSHIVASTLIMTLTSVIGFNIFAFVLAVPLWLMGWQVGLPGQMKEKGREVMHNIRESFDDEKDECSTACEKNARQSKNASATHREDQGPLDDKKKNRRPHRTRQTQSHLEYSPDNPSPFPYERHHRWTSSPVFLLRLVLPTARHRPGRRRAARPYRPATLLKKLAVGIFTAARTPARPAGAALRPAPAPRAVLLGISGFALIADRPLGLASLHRPPKSRSSSMKGSHPHGHPEGVQHRRPEQGRGRTHCRRAACHRRKKRGSPSQGRSRQSPLAKQQAEEAGGCTDGTARRPPARRKR